MMRKRSAVTYLTVLMAPVSPFTCEYLSSTVRENECDVAGTGLGLLCDCPITLTWGQVVPAAAQAGPSATARGFVRIYATI